MPRVRIRSLKSSSLFERHRIFFLWFCSRLSRFTFSLTYGGEDPLGNPAQPTKKFALLYRIHKVLLLLKESPRRGRTRPILSAALGVTARRGGSVMWRLGKYVNASSVRLCSLLAYCVPRCRDPPDSVSTLDASLYVDASCLLFLSRVLKVALIDGF